MKISLLFLSLCLILACNKKTSETIMPVQPQNGSLNKQSYLALGDSYTIGESVSQSGTFPFQLVELLNSQVNDFASPKVIAKTGWTTGELQVAINEAKITKTYDLVTLLIGVNNQYRGNSQDDYRREFKLLLQQAIDFAGGNKKHVYVVSIPDWGVTPFGKNSGRNQQSISAQIDAFNKINKEEADALQVSYVDITPGSRKAGTDLSLVANDGLHPSAKMYADWVSKILAAVKSNGN